VAVEAIVIIPALMLVLLVVIQFALWAHAEQVVQLAASDGDQAARTMGSGPAAGRAQVDSVLSASAATVTSVSASMSILPTDQARVTVTGRAVAILPWMVLSVSATQSGPVQEFRTSG
jgi:Flp pilus assembly protein TadG